MGFDVLETRTVEPKPGWRFRSHLLYADAERLLRDEPALGDRGRHGLRHRLRRPPGRGLTGLAMRHDLASSSPPRRRGGTSRPSRRPCSTREPPDTAPRSSSWSRIRPSWSSTSWPSSSSSSSGAGARRARSRRCGCATAVEGVLDGREPAALRHVGLLSVEPPAGARPARAAAPRAAPGPQPLRDHPDEQERLRGLCVAVAGLSVGRAVVSTLAHEGIGGELRLADFDALDLSNLNRVAGGARRRRREQGRARRARGRRARPLRPRRRVSRRRPGDDDRRLRRRRRRGRRRVRRPGDEGARCASARAPRACRW